MSMYGLEHGSNFEQTMKIKLLLLDKLFLLMLFNLLVWSHNLWVMFH